MINSMDVYYILKELKESLPIDDGCEPVFMVGDSKYGEIMFVVEGRFWKYIIDEPDLTKDLEGENSIVDQIVTDVFDRLNEEEGNQLELDL